MTIERASSCSPTIAEVGFDPGTATLLVVFRTVGAYEFADVPREVFDGLASRAAVGDPLHGYFRAHVKGRYRYRRRRIAGGPDHVAARRADDGPHGGPRGVPRG